MALIAAVEVVTKAARFLLRIRRLLSIESLIVVAGKVVVGGVKGCHNLKGNLFLVLGHVCTKMRAGVKCEQKYRFSLHFRFVWCILVK
jgi:hypothetical protein